MHQIFKLFTGALGAFEAGRAAVAATDEGRPALAHDLRRLGIDPASFMSIGHG